MNIREAYKVMQSQCGIEVGDKVRVLRRAESCEMGWDDVWLSVKDDAVGRIFVVEGDSGCGGLRLSDGWHYPFFVLEMVEKKKPLSIEVILNESYTATVFPDKIKVGCQEFDPVVLDRLVQAHKSVTTTKE